MPKAKYWFFTLKSANIEPSQLESLINNNVAYILCQLERGDGGFEHYQGVMHTVRAVKMSVAKSFTFTHIHLEQCRSAAAHAYVTKEETRIGGPWEFGSPVETGQGRRTDLLEVAGLISQGKRIREIATEHPVSFIKYHRGIERLHQVTMEKPRDPSITPDIWIIIGKTGTGKTRRAWELSGGDLYAKPVDNKWWDGYNGQAFVLFDDFAGDDQIRSESLLSIVDRYPRIVEYKGGSRNLSSSKFIFTSNVGVSEWYLNSSSWSHWGTYHYEAFMRRVNEGQGEIIEM